MKQPILVPDFHTTGVSLLTTIHGRPASKKNSRRIFRNRHTGRPINLPSVAHEEFKTNALAELRKLVSSLNRSKPGFVMFTKPVFIYYIFFIKGKSLQDADNAIASINDVLQGAEVVKDDKLIIAGGFVQLRGYKDWKTEVQIYELAT